MSTEPWTKDVWTVSEVVLNSLSTFSGFDIQPGHFRPTRLIFADGFRCDMFLASFFRPLLPNE